MARKAKSVLKGQPIGIRGLVEGPNGKSYVVMEWTTGDCYVPYRLAKEYFSDLMLDYLLNNPRLMIEA